MGGQVASHLHPTDPVVLGEGPKWTLGRETDALARPHGFADITTGLTVWLLPCRGVSQAPDLGQFVQHRQLDAYEQGMARHSYAYGVDLRRSRWLAGSTVGNAVVRAVDRAWPRLAAHLMDEAMQDGHRTPTELLAEIASHMSLLRAPLPTVRLLRPSARGRWPLVTPLGATRGGATWLVLDVEALLALDPTTRAFLLGAGLGHLHCDHAVYFSAYLLASRRVGQSDAEAGESGISVRMVRSILAPWTRLMSFSADRAGLLCCGDLDRAIMALESPPVPVGEGALRAYEWLPPVPDTATRVHALQEFAQSTIFARVSAMRARQRELSLELSPPVLRPSASESEGAEAPSKPPPVDVHVPADAWSLARVDARLTSRLRLL